MSTSSPILRVAVVGIGEVALNTHLPTLMLMSHMFRLVAIVDVSPGALVHASEKFHVPRTYTRFSQMLAEGEDVDLVMVLSANEYHVSHTILSLQAGKHVFVEKPMALTPSGAEAIEAVRRHTGKIVFVGTMRRYATAFLRVKDMIKQTGVDKIAYVRIRDLIGQNAHFVSQSGAYPRKFNDVSDGEVAHREGLLASMMDEVLGPRASNPPDVTTYNLLASLSVHDLSAMRELIGMPKRVLSAARSPDGNFIWVMFDYGHFTAYYEVGIDNVQVFDAHIEVYTRDKRIKVTFDTPYIKGLPITATILSTKPTGDHSEEILRPTYEDAFTLEYKEMYECIVRGKPVKTGPLDATLDLHLFRMIMDAMV